MSKVISAISGAPSMNKEEVNKFLESKLLLQIGTIDEEGDPYIHLVWFDYDRDREKLLVITSKITKKVKNLKSNQMFIFPQMMKILHSRE
jgi:nitroimidazol reductase NimA-like FMN-containing flavoprotein (pyridoxamine 5'-phosphate oxidase superfamily)